MEKKVENLTDQEIDNLSIQVLAQHLEATKKKIANNKEAKLRKLFTHVDYLQRERRLLLKPKLESMISNPEQEAARAERYLGTLHIDRQLRQENRAKLKDIAYFYVRVQLYRDLRLKRKCDL